MVCRFQGLDRQLANLDRQLEQEVQVTVDRINRLTGELADLNRGLSASYWRDHWSDHDA